MLPRGTILVGESRMAQPLTSPFWAGEEHHLAIFALDPVSIFIEVNPMHRHDFAVRFSHDAKQCILCVTTSFASR